MSSSNEDPKPADNMDSQKQQASSCGGGCSCHSTGARVQKRMVLGVIVLCVAAALVVRAVVRTDATPIDQDTASFTSSIVAQTTLADGTPTTQPVGTPDVSAAKEITALSELNAQAAALDAVFVYVPGKDGASSNPPVAAMKSAADRIGVQGHKIGLFALKAGTRDHDLITTQMVAPGVLAAVKGRGGMIPITGEITETTLIQGFVAASSAGGCGPSGCGPAGCN